MPKFSSKSKAKLESCHPLLQELFNEIIKHVDCTVLEGVRTLDKQKEHVRNGVSKTLKSKHLAQDDGYSHAVDCIAYPIDWNDAPRNYMFAGYIKGIADSLGIEIRLGADWDGDFTAKDQSFHDLPHFELVSTVKKQQQHLPDGPTENDINDALKSIEDDLGI